MNFEKLNICQVTLSGNIEIIKRNYLNFKQFYKNLQFFIICPNADLKKFKRELNLDNLQIHDEDEIIKFDRFKEIANPILKKTIELTCFRIKNKVSNNIVHVTGPGVYSDAINEVMAPFLKASLT